MADGITIKVDGLPELERLFAELAGPAADRAMAHGVAAGAKIFQEAITDAAPVRANLPSGDALPPGKLKANIRIRLRKLRSGVIAAFVEPSPEVRHVSRFLEYGHEMIAGGRKGKGGEVSKKHPFVEKKPFVRPAFESSAHDAIDAVVETTTEELIKEAKSLGLR